MTSDNSRRLPGLHQNYKLLFVNPAVALTDTLDASQDLSVSRNRERLACRQADHSEGALGSLPRSGSTCGHYQVRAPSPDSTCFGILHHLSEFIHSKGNCP